MDLRRGEKKRKNKAVRLPASIKEEEAPEVLKCSIQEAHLTRSLIKPLQGRLRQARYYCLSIINMLKYSYSYIDNAIKYSNN